MPELALDDHQRDALARHLDRVCMPELVRREPATHPGCDRGSACSWTRIPAGGARPAASRAAQDAEQRADRQARTKLEPGIELLPRPTVHPDLAALDRPFRGGPESRRSRRSRSLSAQRERFADPQPGAPQHDDQPPKPDAVGLITSGAHDGDDLLDASAGPVDSGALCCEVVGRGGTRAGSLATGAGQRDPRVERIP